MKIYHPRQFGELLVTSAAIKGSKSVAYALLLIDTGATYTTINPKVLQKAGYDLTHISDYRTVVTGSRNEKLPRIHLERFSSLGQDIENYPVLVHTLPATVEKYIDGVLGMDFLKRFPIEIRPYTGEIVVRGG